VKRIYLSRADRKIAGVCGGLAEYLEMDPTLVRLIAIFLLVFTGILPMVIVYLVAWAVIPNQP
jgi:phage shock protein C